jgi:hypothetical protein
VLVAALLAAVLVLVFDPDGDDGRPVVTAAPTTAAAPATPPAEPAPTDPEATPTPGAEAVPAPVTGAEAATGAAPAPATEAQAAPLVAREGVPAAARTVAAAPAGFTAPAEWADGASVAVTAARQQVSSGSGPGALAGQPQTLFTLEVRNGATGPLDLNAVVVQATYGEGAQASPLYDGATLDFSGSLEPGATATAVYSFAIPADELSEVSLSVDVDGMRFPAVFTGTVPAT